MPRIERGEPPYLQVVRHIRDDITSGRLEVGARVPSARQLAVEWGIAHATAAKVIATLRTEGTVRTMPGAGTVVAGREDRHLSGQDNSVAVHRTGRIYPSGYHAQVHAAGLAAAPPEVVLAFGLPDGVEVVRRVRTTFDGAGLAVSCSTSWLDPTLADSCPDLLIAERIVEGTIGYISRLTGRAAATGSDELAAGVAATSVAERLGVEPGSPVLVTRTRWLDQQGDVLEFGESFTPAGRWVRYEYSVRSREE